MSSVLSHYILLQQKRQNGSTQIFLYICVYIYIYVAGKLQFGETTTYYMEDTITERMSIGEPTFAVDWTARAHTTMKKFENSSTTYSSYLLYKLCACSLYWTICYSTYHIPVITFIK